MLDLSNIAIGKLPDGLGRLTALLMLDGHVNTPADDLLRVRLCTDIQSCCLAPVVGKCFNGSEQCPRSQGGLFNTAVPCCS